MSVRTLRHYDAIGLLCPKRHERNGYRIYEEPELLRLQQILFYRELEVRLEDIKRLLAQPDFNVRTTLLQHRQTLQHKRKRLDQLLKTIDKTLLKLDQPTFMPDEELYDVFKDEDVKPHQEEVRQRWGKSDAYKQSMARVSKMTKQEMDALKAAGTALTQALADAMEKGPSHPDVQAFIKKHYEGICFFYDCPLEMYRNLGQMYVDDPRFAAYYEKFRPGLATFMKEAIMTYASSPLP